jgi:hypothetical protein
MGPIVPCGSSATALRHGQARMDKLRRTVSRED